MSAPSHLVIQDSPPKPLLHDSLMKHSSILRAAAALLVVVLTASCSNTDVRPADGKDDETSTVGPNDEQEPSHGGDADLPSSSDVRALMEGVAAGGPQVMDSLSLTKKGSPAHGYIQYLAHSAEADIDGGWATAEPGTVKEQDGGYEICYPGGDEGPICYLYGAFEGASGKVVDFEINGKPVGPRLVVGNGRPVTGTGGLQGTFMSAFETSSSNELVVGYQLRVRDGAFISQVTYRSPDGRQSSAARTTGATELGADSMSNFTSAFPGAKLGGVVTVTMYSESAGQEATVSFETKKRR